MTKQPAFATMGWVGAWNLVALVMFVRSLALGPAMVPSWQIALVVLLLLVIATWIRLPLLGAGRDASETEVSTIARWAPMTLTPGALIYALWLSNLHPMLSAGVFIWLILLASEILVFVRCCLGLNMLPETLASRRVGGLRCPEQLADENTLDAHPLGDDIVQRIERSRDGDCEVVRGLVRIDFQPGQRIAIASVGFVPPLLNDPSAEAESIGGCDAVVTVAEIHPQGVEFELRRKSGEDDENFSIVEFFASAQQATSSHPTNPQA